MTASLPLPVDSEIDWHGTGWRVWRLDRGQLRNPWTNNTTDYWLPGRIQRAYCTNPLRPAPMPCNGYISGACSCGIRSMATLDDLAVFLARGRQLVRHPQKAAVVGQVRIGGRVEYHIPGLPPRPGYQRSEFAEIIGPLYVSPYANCYLSGYRAICEVIDSSALLPLPHPTAQQEWIEALAQERRLSHGDELHPATPHG